MKLIGIVLLLAFFTYEDIRCRRISIWLLLLGYLSAVFYLIFFRELAMWEYLAGGCMGVLFLYLSLVSGNIGTGDGALIMLLGFLLGIRHQMGVVLLALLFCAAVAIVLFLTGRAGRRSRLPFVPFLFGAFCITLFHGLIFGA